MDDGFGKWRWQASAEGGSPGSRELKKGVNRVKLSRTMDQYV